ncbi:MAG: hypothetical protein LBB10_03210 [Bifidobacteriaceae bacterium]|nr:hypothetical protein [Bifidobacteriaceae bacterium]
MKKKINKIGAALTVLTFGLICGISGYELKSSTDSATSPLPIAKGGTSANTAETARDNLSLYSKSEIDASIASTTDWKAAGINVGDTRIYTKLFDNVPLSSYRSGFSVPLIVQDNNGSRKLELFINRVNSATPSSALTSAQYCATGPSTGLSYAVAVQQSGSVYSIWLTIWGNSWINLSAKKYGLYIPSGGGSRIFETALTNSSTTAPSGTSSWITASSVC